MRRVVDCAGALGAEGTVVVGRAGRAFLDGSGITSEVFNTSKVCARLVKAVQSLSAPATCKCQRCGCVTGAVSIVMDADQASEACSAGAVLRAWDRIEHVIEERNERRVQRVEKAQRLLERNDPAYRAWREEEREREREEDLRKQGQALSAAMVSRWTRRSADVRLCQLGCRRLLRCLRG